MSCYRLCQDSVYLTENCKNIVIWFTFQTCMFIYLFPFQISPNTHPGFIHWVRYNVSYTLSRPSELNGSKKLKSLDFN